MKPFFSILIPVYNQVGKMEECIASLDAQEFTDYEVIFVNDGSTDTSQEMLEEYAKKDRRRRILVHESNRSLLFARYTGMKEAKGEYILFLDSDDFLSHDALGLLHERLTETAEPPEILRFGFVTEPEGTKTSPIETKDILLSVLTGEITPSVWKNCYKRNVIEDLLQKTEPFYCNMAEDACLSGMLYSIAKSFGILDQCIYHYNSGGMSSSGSNLSLEKMKRDMRSVEEAGSHLTGFMEKYDPLYASAARISAKRMVEFVILQHVVFEESWEKVFDYLRFVKDGEDGRYEQFFDMACNKLIPVRVKYAIGISLTKEDKENIFSKYEEDL